MSHSCRFKKSTAKMRWKWKKKRTRRLQRKRRKMKTVTYVEATPKILEEIKNFNIKNEALLPKYLPMLMPPREWENPFVGGYYGKKHNYKQQTAKEISNTLANSKENK